MTLDELVSDIFKPHHEQIKTYIVKQILEDVVDIVLERIYADINMGKIRLEGILDKDAIFKQVIEKMKLKGEANV
jgi:hypothetical protein